MCHGYVIRGCRGPLKGSSSLCTSKQNLPAPQHRQRLLGNLWSTGQDIPNVHNMKHLIDTMSNTAHDTMFCKAAPACAQRGVSLPSPPLNSKPITGHAWPSWQSCPTWQTLSSNDSGPWIVLAWLPELSILFPACSLQRGCQRTPTRFASHHMTIRQPAAPRVPPSLLLHRLCQEFIGRGTQLVRAATEEGLSSSIGKADGSISKADSSISDLGTGSSAPSATPAATTPARAASRASAAWLFGGVGPGSTRSVHGAARGTQEFQATRQASLCLLRLCQNLFRRTYLGSGVGAAGAVMGGFP